MYLSKITVTLRKSILDPQGKAVEHGIHSLGFESVEDVRIGKFIELSVNASSKKEAEQSAAQEALERMEAKFKHE